MYKTINSIKFLFAVIGLLLVSGALLAQQQDSTKASKIGPAKTAKDSIKRVTGKIMDAVTGKPVSGINIAITGYSAAITDEKGNFTIKTPYFSSVLTISGQGYQTKDVALKGRKNVTTVLFEDGYNSVYSKAVMPFGEAKLNSLTGSVASVNTNGGWDTKRETADSYLQGRIGGLNAIRRSGTPNIGADLFLRGYSSLYATNKPLVIVDGMIYDNAQFGTSLIQGHSNNPLSNINFNDIDNFTVIRDAASVYGTKAANGVILITTGHTNDLATHIDFGVSGGFNFRPRGLPVMQAADYRVFLGDILRSTGMNDAAIQATPYYNDDPTSANYAAYHNNTDWQKQVFKTSYSSNYYLRVSGGDNIAKYTLSMGYGSDEGVTRNTPLDSYSTRFNANLNLSKSFSVDANLSFNYNEQKLFDQGQAPATNPISLSLIKSPLARLHEVNAAGVESPNLSNLDLFNVGNPAILIDTANEVSKTYRFFGNVNFKYKLNRFSSLQSAIGITYGKARETYFIPRAGITPDTSRNAIIYSRLGSQVQRLFSITNDTHYSYDRTFNLVHHFSGNIGFRFMDTETSAMFAQGANSATDQFISVGTGTNLQRSTGGELGDWRWLNTYMGLNYDYFNKYFISYNMAVDGSSRFGSNIPGALSIGGLQMAILPSLSIGWLISSESYMSRLSFVEFLKLRASYGLTGNDDIGNYAARQYYISQNLLGQQGLIRGNIANPNLQWELNKKVDFGFDAALLKGRLNITFDMYQNNTSHMLVNDPASAYTGFDYAVDNAGAMRTRGLELSLGARLINKPKMKWDLGLNIAKYSNVITALPNNSMTTTYAGANVVTQVGSAANLFYGYKTNGVYTTNAEATASGLTVLGNGGLPFSPKGGDVRFVDNNGDGVIDSRDMQVIGDPNSDFFGGINTTFTYSKFTLSVLFTFSKGGSNYNYVRRSIESESGFENQSLAVNNRWRADGQITAVPRANFGDAIGNSRFSDRWIEDGSYFRLRTATLAYDVPFKIKGVRSFKCYVTGNNLFTFTKYLGYDPEFSATESVLTQGIDTGLEPQFRSLQLGVRLGL
ncbi:SusC/RagA family TonB-linked outer membrane protein [Mucilaginibacter sp. HMF5004]|uniref:SusC/RagA family TonB-linked outer membrane protein n=1 Tax=Mucilaginibacter rivuli TaxID=2857527 RepID=UPI001C6049A8|nr:SusC/RagA family TonB-linked outer membrane protein [Mucilaginibacter rivuli]MBW4888974.1 SusC/RagA family TonB-linked outer membrane protein [Mucilaginibacter rivuli]